MTKETKNRFLVLTTMILLAVATRLMPHPYNFAPITGIALFGGSQFSSKKSAFLVPMIAMFLSDLVLGFHTTMLAVYVSFAAIVGIGFWLRKKQTFSRIVAATMASSILFFLVTNFGTWALQSLYPKTAAGLATCYIAAIPFFQNTLLGDLVYSGVLFGSLSLIQKVLPSLRESELVIAH